LKLNLLRKKPQEMMENWGMKMDARGNGSIGHGTIPINENEPETNHPMKMSDKDRHDELNQSHMKS